MICEMAHVQVGQCTIVIGNAFWNTVSVEHKLAEDDKFAANKDDADIQQRLDKIDVYFKKAGELILRFDSEVGSLDVIKTSSIDTMVERDNFVFGTSGGDGNNWAKAHYTEDAQLIDHDALVDVIGKELEGESGTCSGLALLLFMKMIDHYSDRIIDPFLENSDEALILYNKWHDILKQQEPKYTELNWGNDSSIVASLRFSGKLNGNWHQLI